MPQHNLRGSQQVVLLILLMLDDAFCEGLTQ